MARHDASDLAYRLGRQAEAVCRHYLSNGRRQGNYWQVGDARNAAGQSMHVRLAGAPSGKGAAGKWTDEATGEHGDLLDIIRTTLGLTDFKDVVAEARAFLQFAPLADPKPPARTVRSNPNRTDAAARLFGISMPIPGTIVKTYLRNRGITYLREVGSLRFHPRCYYRHGPGRPTEMRPAMVAAVSDLTGAITGAHRTWLRPDGSGKADVPSPRRAMGELLGNAVRFGMAGRTMVAGEGIETTLSFRTILPGMPALAGLSAAHLAAIAFPPELRRLYILRDRDPAGDNAVATLMARAACEGIEACAVSPRDNDMNADLQALGVAGLRNLLLPQVAPEDWASFSRSDARIPLDPEGNHGPT